MNKIKPVEYLTDELTITNVDAWVHNEYWGWYFPINNMKVETFSVLDKVDASHQIVGDGDVRIEGIDLVYKNIDNSKFYKKE